MVQKSWGVEPRNEAIASYIGGSMTSGGQTAIGTVATNSQYSQE